MNFTVYKSSAGSGKTYTLVREYLKLVLTEPHKFRHILAITFTNKAANEMKQRIINSLKEISDFSSFSGSIAVKFMLPELEKETGLDRNSISENAGKVLELILHNYSDFAICTIDSFVHRIIRSFAFDLHLPLNFEVEVDTDDLIAKVIDILISNVGTDEKLTRMLINFTQSKTDDEKSWHIENDLTEIAKILTKEDGQIHIEKLKKLNLDDFSQINRQVNTIIRRFENTLTDYAKDADNLIKSKGIPHQAFYRGSSGICKYFEYLVNKRFDKVLPNSYVIKTIKEDKWYSGKANTNEKAAIDEIKENIRLAYERIAEYVDKHYQKYVILNEIRKNLYPVAVLNEIEKVMDEYKSENNIVLISEFNKRIADIVLNEPVPFIYERLGEKYKHFLIDEFQDTSVLQWLNLLPLIDNSLSEGNFNMVVGDGKQAIYRWRSGEVEQFAKLPKIYKKKDDPVLIQREQSLERNYQPEVLEHNYRSKAEIVDFNNDFFAEISEILPEGYRLIYSDLKQKFDKENTGGFVQIEFPGKNNEELTFADFNLQRIKETIDDLQADEFNLKDIAILCRSNKNASLIAGYLLENDINVVSSESLLLSNSAQVKFLIAVIKAMFDPYDRIAKTGVISYLTLKGILQGKLHENLKGFGIYKNKNDASGSNENRFYKVLSEYNFNLNKTKLLNLPIYDLCEELIRIFNLNRKVNPYIQFFLDAVLKLSTDQSPELQDFFDWWEEKKDKLSIVVPEGINAIRVMTIHKAKGLEFPVVIYPFATDKHKKTKDKLWIDFENKEIPKLKTALVNANKILEKTGYSAQYIEEDQKSLLDLVNLLYVVMTRPTDRLYIFSAQPPEKDDAVESVPKFLKYYFKIRDVWENDKTLYTFGEKKKYKSKAAEEGSDFTLNRLISSEWKNRMLLSLQAPEHWEVEDPDKKQEWGNLIHLILSKIRTFEDVDTVMDSLYFEGVVDTDEKIKIAERIKRFLSNPEVKKYFEKGLTIKTESEILLPDGKTYRPDRLIIYDDSVTVIDFKTGKPEAKHKEQVRFYKKIVKQLGYVKVQGVLLYFDEQEPVVMVE